MNLFFLALITFGLLVVGTGALYLLIERTFLGPKTEQQVMMRERITENHTWWLASVLYIGFMLLLYFLLASAFATEMYIGEWGNLPYYLYGVFPAAIIGGLAFYFGARWLGEQSL